MVKTVLRIRDQHMEFGKKRTLERIIDAAKNLKEAIQAFPLARLEDAETRKEFLRIMDTESEGLILHAQPVPQPAARDRTPSDVGD